MRQHKQIQAGRLNRRSYSRKLGLRSESVNVPSRRSAGGSAPFNCVKYPIPTRGTPCEGRRVRKRKPVYALRCRTLTHDTANKAVSSVRRGRRISCSASTAADRPNRTYVFSTCRPRVSELRPRGRRDFPKYGERYWKLFIRVKYVLCPPGRSCSEFVELSIRIYMFGNFRRNTKDPQTLEIDQKSPDKNFNDALNVSK